MPVSFPDKFTWVQLKHIARLCGRTRSGTKSVLIDRIIEDLKDFKPLAPGTRVLSIDLGIRNLAYSLLEVPAAGNEPRRRKETIGRKKEHSAVFVTPILHAWERLALIPKSAQPVSPKGEKGKKGEKQDTTDQDPDHLDPVADEDPAATTPVPTEDFSPSRLSPLAVDLILNHLLPLKPDIVILEQQRFRSMGSSGVLEWTLRVNSLESMLYAVFATLRKLGYWESAVEGGGRLEGVVARNVLEFMAVQDSLRSGLAVKDIWSKDGDNKKVKKDIVGRMLASGEGVVVEKDLEAVVTKEYLAEWQGKKKRMPKAERMGKLDDFADCLLQGIAFIQWQENKRRLIEGGVEALEDQIGE